MPNHARGQFLAGVIEGFYGQPWARHQRLQLFDWMAAWGLNTYLYAPKDDLKHRARWRELYTEAEAAELRDLIQQTASRGLRFIYAIGPGLDVRYASESDRACLRARIAQMLGLGCRDFAILFDDIPDRMSPEDLAEFGSFASAQCRLTNALFEWVRQQSPDARFLFCPTPYCGRMAMRELGGAGYLESVGRELLPEIEVFWTGPEIISREITVPHVQELRQLLRRKPLIWDNLHANDYDGRRFYCGPYSGRAPALRQEVSGLLVNPNNEFALNFVPFRTLARFVQAGPDWHPRAAYLEAMGEWQPRFTAAGRSFDLADLLLLGDCYYLPYEEGPGAEQLFEDIRALLAIKPDLWNGDAVAGLRGRILRLRDAAAKIVELDDRDLFYALSRRFWELREELDLLDRYLAAKSLHPWAPAGSDFHLPGTYRGGLVPRLQRLLGQNPDASFHPTFAQPTS